MKRRAFFILLPLLIFNHFVAAAPVQAPGLVETYPKVCQQGLYQQPNDGSFAVMVFCDDAMGTHLGVICYFNGQICDGNVWTLENRFWQEEAWTDDVTAFAWDPSGKCLYVSTSEIYGTGDLYRLNLAQRKYVALPSNLKGKLAENGSYATTLTKLDTKNQRLEYTIEYYNVLQNKPVTETKSIKLDTCGN